MLWYEAGSLHKNKAHLFRQCFAVFCSWEAHTFRRLSIFVQGRMHFCVQRRTKPVKFGWPKQWGQCHLSHDSDLRSLSLIVQWTARVRERWTEASVGCSSEIRTGKHPGTICIFWLHLMRSFWQGMTLLLRRSGLMLTLKADWADSLRDGHGSAHLCCRVTVPLAPSYGEKLRDSRPKTWPQTQQLGRRFGCWCAC